MSSNNYEYICPNHRLIRNLGGNGTMVTIQYSGVKLVSIRRFHWVKGERRPSKGISLTVQQWLNLKKNMDAIEKAYHERSAYSESDPDDEIVVCDLGSSKDGHKMVCVKSWKKQIRIDIRECYFEDGIRKNGRKGISLPMKRWIKLRSCIRQIDNAVDKELRKLRKLQKH